MDFKVQYEEGYSLVFQGRSEEGLEKLLPLEGNIQIGGIYYS